jgi:hypothetical protein
MPSIQFGLSSYQRARGDLPELPVVNLFAEEAPTEETGVVLQSRPGLDDRGADMGAGPVRQLFQRDLVLSTALFGVSGSTLYSGTTALGSIDGTGHVSMAGYSTNVFIAAGAGLWGYDGTTLAEIALPDSFDAVKVLVAASRVVAIRKDTGKFYWSDSLEDDIEALDFATAESQPDRLLDMVFIDDTLVLGGAETIEFWPNTGDSNLPFQPLEGRVIEKGVKATGCMVPFGSTFAWVTNGNQVCLGDENGIISNPGLEEQIEASTECLLFVFNLGGIEFLALRLDDETHAWSWRSKLWSQFASYGEGNWVAQCFAGGVFGSAVDGKTLAWGDGHTDLGGVLERRFRAGMAINSGGVVINNVQIRCNVGQTPYLTGDYIEPKAEMRISRDAGQTFGSWRAVELGAQGNYRQRVQWRACGLASQPAFLAEFRVTAPVDWRVSDVLANEPYGGR